MTDSRPNAIRSADLSNSEKVAAVAWQTVREMFPVANNESDYAVKTRLRLLGKIVDEIGYERFMEALDQAMSISQRRYDVTPARIRECAGLRWVSPPTAAALSWEWVMRVFVDHCRVDGKGNFHLEDKVVMLDGLATVTPAPKVPQAIQRALRSMGGWSAISEAFPEYIGQRYAQFKELFHEDEPGPRADLGVGLEKIG